MRTVEIEVFPFTELSSKAKEKARAWYRGQIEADEYAEAVYEDAARIAKILGIEFDTDGKLPFSGAPRPRIYWSGFSSQGDGANFEGSYSFAPNAPAKIREYAPNDTWLHQIADKLAWLQGKHGNKLTATVKHRGRYYHEFCTEITTTHDSDDDHGVGFETETAMADRLRMFMRWIYRQLEEAHNYAHSDEAVDEAINANEYEFEADGTHYA